MVEEHCDKLRNLNAMRYTVNEVVRMYNILKMTLYMREWLQNKSDIKKNVERRAKAKYKTNVSRQEDDEI
jgi:hypothetical protein